MCKVICTEIHQLWNSIVRCLNQRIERYNHGYKLLRLRPQAFATHETRIKITFLITMTYCREIGSWNVNGFLKIYRRSRAKTNFFFLDIFLHFRAASMHTRISRCIVTAAKNVRVRRKLVKINTAGERDRNVFARTQLLRANENKPNVFLRT